MELDPRQPVVPPVAAVVAALVLAAACSVLSLQVHGATAAAAGTAAPLVALVGYLLRQVLQLEGRLAATGRQLARASYELAELARLDPLTGTLNRAAFEELATHQLSRVDGEHRSLVYLELGGVDRRGPKAAVDADAVVVGLAEALRANVRPDDLVCRLGPDAFVVVLRHSDSATASGVVERLVGVLPGSVEICAGVATTNGPVVLGALLDEAAGQLETARREGRPVRAAFVRPSPVPLLPAFNGA